MIEDRYKPQAQTAVNFFRTVLLAVEECGADPELTAIVTVLSDLQSQMRRLFGLIPGQITMDMQPQDVIKAFLKPPTISMSQGLSTSMDDLIEHLACYLVNERRTLDMMINEGCDPYEDWDNASDAYRNHMRAKARRVLIGEEKG